MKPNKMSPILLAAILLAMIFSTLFAAVPSVSASAPAVQEEAGQTGQLIVQGYDSYWLFLESVSKTTIPSKIYLVDFKGKVWPAQSYVNGKPVGMKSFDLEELTPTLIVEWKLCQGSTISFCATIAMDVYKAITFPAYAYTQVSAIPYMWDKGSVTINGKTHKAFVRPTHSLLLQSDHKIYLYNQSVKTPAWVTVKTAQNNLLAANGGPLDDTWTLWFSNPTWVYRITYAAWIKDLRIYVLNAKWNYIHDAVNHTVTFTRHP